MLINIIHNHLNNSISTPFGKMLITVLLNRLTDETEHMFNNNNKYKQMTTKVLINSGGNVKGET